MAEIDVDIVAVERELWSGKATFVFARTTVGEIGILPRHIPLVAQLVDDAHGARRARAASDDLRIAVRRRVPVGDRGGRDAFWPSPPSSSPRSTSSAAQGSDAESDDPSDRGAEGRRRGCAPWASSTRAATSR